jgi:hypothetical protein
MKTIFVDIDGTVLKHNGNLSSQITTSPSLLPGVIEAFNEWNMKGYCIILTTGRKECMRSITERDLLAKGIFYDQLIMGLPRGERVLINDSKPDCHITAQAITVTRNKGLSDILI